MQVEVSPADLDEVYQAVMRVERTRAFSDWCSGQRFWIEFLESTQAPSFAAVRERSAQALAQLEGQAGLSREAAAVQMNAIHDNFRNERQALLRRLTEEALARNPVNEVAGSRDVDEEASV